MTAVRPLVHKPEEAAKLLRCTAWWLRDQARKRKIPYSWIGGCYRFTDAQIAEILRLKEVRPSTPGAPPAPLGKTTRRRRTPTPAATGTALKARVPPRVRAMCQNPPAA